MKSTMSDNLYRIAMGLLIILASLNLTGCGSDSDGVTTTGSTGGSNGGTSLGNGIKNVALVAGVESQIKFTYTVPATATPLTSLKGFSINLAETMQYVTISSSPVAKRFDLFDRLKLFAGVSRAMAASTATLTAFVSYAGDPDVCSSPHRFGPLSVTGDVGSSLTSGTSSASPTQAMIDIVSAGAFEVCLVFVPPIDAYLSVSSVAVELEECDEAPVPIADTTWTGYYNCTNFGTSDESGSITLTITQNDDGSYHYSDDGGADYDGHLCGNRFRFKGGVMGSYTESGTLLLNSDGFGSKTSAWNSFPPGTAGGSCEDVLERI